MIGRFKLKSNSWIRRQWTKAWIQQLNFIWKNILTSPVFLSQEYCRFSLFPSFFTNQNVFDTNNLLLLNTTCHVGSHKLKQEKVNATLHLLHLSPVRLTLLSPAIFTSRPCLFPAYLSWCICHHATRRAPFTGLGCLGISLHSGQ